MRKKTKMRLHLFGSTNAIALRVQELVRGIDVQKYKFSQFLEFGAERKFFELSKDVQHIVIYSWGVLHPERLLEQDQSKIWSSIYFNFVLPARLLEMVNESGVQFRYIYISSESAHKGSYDGTYAMSKAAMERFIREIRINNKESSCVGIAPSMIEDCGMTLRRTDQKNVRIAAASHPKNRLLRSNEVADLVVWLMNGASDYITNTTIAVNGGKFSRMLYK
jgi:NAD(P)-dependent dehydrogenase (short-subunit alcohol dehydrogenase family)